jgi:hypothetical protein
VFTVSDKNGLFGQDTQADPFYYSHRNWQIHFNVGSTSDDVWRGVPSKVLEIHFPKVSLNVTCQPLYESAI